MYSVHYVKSLQQDQKRLNFLDSNIKMNLGWEVTTAPAGNISIRSVIQIKDLRDIRTAIDQAMAKEVKE